MTKQQRQEWKDYKLSCPEKVLSDKSLRTNGKNWFKDFQEIADKNMELKGLPKGSLK